MFNEPVFYMVAIQAAVTLAFVVLWLGDKAKHYLLWWALAHLGVSMLTLVVYSLGSPSRGSSTIHFIVYHIAHSLTSTAFMAAALSCRSVFFHPRTAAVSCLFLGFFAFLLGFYVSYPLSELFAGFAMVAAFALTAWAMWGRSWLTRITAVFFGFRALNAFFFVILSLYSQVFQSAGPALSILIVMTLVSAMLLLLNVVHRGQIELKNHIKFLSLTQAISRSLQGVADITVASQKITDLLLRRQVWMNAAVFIPDENDNDHLQMVAADGPSARQGQGAPLMRIPVNSSLPGQAFLSKQIVSNYDAYTDQVVARYEQYISSPTDQMTLAAVPLINDDQVYGVLVVTRVTNGLLLPEELSILENIGEVMGLVVANIRHLAELSYRVNHDALTGLGNRIALHEYFENQSAENHIVLMLFDLNRFKEVNDTLGHSVGDGMLCTLAERLRTQLENEAIKVYRLGGDEFVVSYNMSAGSVLKERLAEQLSRLIDGVITVDGLALRTSASIGVVEARGRDIDSHELLRCADLAMYEAKSQSLPIAYYQETADHDIQLRAKTIDGIAIALEQNQLELAYQPIIDLQNRCCSKCEALVRWRHPVDGLIDALRFMPIIEATQMIVDVTRVVSKMAIKAAKQWQLQGCEMTVSINLSARNLLDDGLAAELLDETIKCGLNPSYIQLEITETMLMTDRSKAEQVLGELVAAGFSIALDDFGTGHSSLAYLASFPIHTLKIDRSFTQKMSADTRTKAIVEATIELSRNLGLGVVGEGVETLDEANSLTEMGCQFAQGYFYTKPLLQNEFNDWLRNYRY